MKEIKKPSTGGPATPFALAIERKDKVNAIVTGWFFIAATVSAIIGAVLYRPILHTDSFFKGAASSNQIVSGAVSEMVLVVTACSTAIMLYPYLKAHNERLALGYFCFRLLEAVCILLGLVSVLSMLTISQSYVGDTNHVSGTYNAIGALAKAFHDWTFILGPKFLLGINTSIYSYVFLKTGLVPKRLALLGLAGAVLVFVNAVLEMFGVVASESTADVLLSLPIASYEMILAGRLIVRGFNVPHPQQADNNSMIP